MRARMARLLLTEVEERWSASSIEIILPGHRRALQLVQRIMR
jgi:hypothetical protein